MFLPVVMYLHYSGFYNPSALHPFTQLPDFTVLSYPHVFVTSPSLFSFPTSALSPLRLRGLPDRRNFSFVFLLLMGGIESNPGPYQRGRCRNPLSSRPLKFSILNVRSAVNKAAEIHDTIESYNLDVLLLSETWIQQNSPPSVKLDIAPVGYRVFHVHRSTTRTRGQKAGLAEASGDHMGGVGRGHLDRSVKAGGGLAVIYRDSLSVSDISSEFNIYKTFEILTVRIKLLNRSITLIGIYRPPPAAGSTFFIELAELLDATDTVQGETIICGDFNCPGQSTLTIDPRLSQQLSDHNLVQYVNCSTRKQNGNILDLIIARNGLIKSENIMVNEVGFSDHNLLSFDVNICAPAIKQVSYSFRNVANIDTEAFMRDIYHSALFTSPLLLVDEYFDLIKTTVTAALDKFAPLKQRTKRAGQKPTAKWMTDEAKNFKRNSRRLERRYRQTRSEEDYILYRQANRIAVKSVRAARSSFYRDGLANNSNSPQAHWRIIKEVLHSADRPSPVNVNEAERLATSFTQFFINKLLTIRVNISSKLALMSHISLPISPSPSIILTTFSPVSDLEVDQLLRTTPSKSSPLDFIPTSLLKSCSKCFSPIIAELANRSFTQGSFPTELKIAQVTPLLKKHGLNPSDPSNYRPISNLNTIGKLLERLALSRLRPHIITSPNYCQTQSAYRPGHSTETALLDIINRLAVSAGSRRTSLLCTIDLSAAFDTVNHNKLGERLKTDFGLDATVGAWLRSYLIGRKQFVKVDGAVGEVTINTSGVPQGSVLGPLLFSAYMSPIGRLISQHGVNQHHYADDTTLLIELDGPADCPSPRLSSCVHNLVTWCLQNDMQINPDKTEMMLVAASSQLKNYDQSVKMRVADSHVKFNDSVKILGVTIDSQLLFDKHVSSVCQSCNFHIKALRHVRHMLSIDTANQIACSIVASRLDYCNSLLYGTSVHNITRLQRIQNNLARVVCNAPSRASAAPLLNRLHWLPIEQRITYKISTLTYSVLHDSGPSYLYDSLHHYIPSRTLRSSDAHLLMTSSNPRSLAVTEKAFSSFAPKIWNTLSLKTRSSPSTASFKSNLKTELFIIAESACLP